MFHSAVNFSSSQQEGNTGRKIYFSVLSDAVISLGNSTVYKCRHQGSAVNMQGIEHCFSNAR